MNASMPELYRGEESRRQVAGPRCVLRGGPPKARQEAAIGICNPHFAKPGALVEIRGGAIHAHAGERAGRAAAAALQCVGACPRICTTHHVCVLPRREWGGRRRRERIQPQTRSEGGWWAASTSWGCRLGKGARPGVRGRSQSQTLGLAPDPRPEEPPRGSLQEADWEVDRSATPLLMRHPARPLGCLGRFG